MEEHGVFWAGRQPSGAKKAELSAVDEARLTEGLREVCAAAGYKLNSFVAARGVYGSWLAMLDGQDGPRRILWNGQDKALLLQRPGGPEGWEPLGDCALATGEPGEAVANYINGARELLGAAD